jgi:prepilin-type N-terminal cleavage/methylation domain-containing protein
MRSLPIKKHQSAGFTIIELLAVIVIIGILLALVVSSYASIQRDQRNQDRQQDINQIYEQLEAYYVENSKYPTLANINNLNWVAINMKTLDKSALKDPSSNSYLLVAKPTKDAFAYTVMSSAGTTCNNVTVICAHYTLTATLEASALKTYVKTSLN